MIAARKLVISHPYVGSGSASANAAAVVLRDESFDLAPLALAHVKLRLEMLKRLHTNWDGHGSAKPDWAAIERALGTLSEFFRGAALTQYGWSNPHVSTSENGGIVLEWWRDPRKLTVYITVAEISFIRVWGDDVDTEMDEGILTANTRLEFEYIWSWLNS